MNRGRRNSPFFKIKKPLVIKGFLGLSKSRSRPSKPFDLRGEFSLANEIKRSSRFLSFVATDGQVIGGTDA
jgi:hypothetical protein